MRVCILSDLNSFEGIGVYAQEIYQRLKKTHTIDYIYLDYPSRCMFSDPNGERRVLRRLTKLPFESKPLFWLRANRHLPHYDLYHITSQNLAFMGKNRKFVQTVHDLIPLFIPGSFFHKKVRRWLYSGISSAKYVMADSESSRQDILRVFQIPAQNVSVVTLGVAREFRPVDRQIARQQFRFSDDRKYILHVGIDKWRKNVEGAVKALFKLRQRMPNAFLVRVGRNSTSTQELIAKLGLSEAVINYSYISQKDLVSLYGACDVLLFPSFYEGFGLPVLEAMACGLPVIASDRSSIPEVTGDSAELLDPNDPDLMCQKLKLVLTDSTKSQELRQKGLKRAKDFDWDKTASSVAEIYARAT